MVRIKRPTSRILTENFLAKILGITQTKLMKNVNTQELLQELMQVTGGKD